jgi:hypothetical protein
VVNDIRFLPSLSLSHSARKQIIKDIRDKKEYKKDRNSYPNKSYVGNKMKW